MFSSKKARHVNVESFADLEINGSNGKLLSCFHFHSYLTKNYWNYLNKKLS